MTAIGSVIGLKGDSLRLEFRDVDGAYAPRRSPSRTLLASSTKCTRLPPTARPSATAALWVMFDRVFPPLRPHLHARLVLQPFARIGRLGAGGRASRGDDYE